MRKTELGSAKLEASRRPAGPPHFAWENEASGQLLLALLSENEDFASWRASRRPETFSSKGLSVSVLLVCGQSGQVRSEGLRNVPDRSGQPIDS